MGGIISKLPFNRKKKKEDNVTQTVTTDHPDGHRLTEEDKEQKRIHETLRHDLETFLLNNLLLSVQFFENYERDMHEIRYQSQTQTDEENNLNSKLNIYRKKTFQVDEIHELVSKNVRFQPKHGLCKDNPQSLHPSKTYITYENIEVRLPNGTNRKSSHVPDLVVHVDTEENEKLAESGYVNLLVDEDIFKEDNDYEELHPVAENTKQVRTIPTIQTELVQDEILSPGQKFMKKLEEKVDKTKTYDNKNVHNTLLQVNNRLSHIQASDESNNSSTSSSRSHSRSRLDDDTDYAYVTIQSLTKPQRVDESRLGHLLGFKGPIPVECFHTKKIAIMDDKRKNKKTDKPFNFYNFFKSVEFLRFFFDEFVELLAEPLDVRAFLNEATTQGIFLRCENNGVLYYFAPVLEYPEWPACALEYSYRKRNTKILPNQKCISWPTEKMLMNIRSFGASLVPLGYLQKRGYRVEFQLEWKIEFPKAEKYLFENLMHVQMRIYLFLLVLFKNFLEFEELSLTPLHLLHFLFWEIENHCEGWPEERLGEVFKEFLQKLYDKLQNQKLNDYFISKRNLFENIPRKFLNKVQEKLFRICENPIPFLIIAFRNLNIRNKFYPKLDYKKLHKILIVKNIAKLLNPQLSMLKQPQVDEEHESEEDEEQKQDINDDRVKFFQQMEKEKEKEKEAIENERKLSIDSIDIQKTINKKNLTNKIRIQEILKIFIPHFLQMIRVSIRFDAIDQAQLYLEHVKKLVNIFEAEEADEEQVDIFKQKIKTLQKEIFKNDEDDFPIYEPLKGLSGDFHQNLEESEKEEESESDFETYETNVFDIEEDIPDVIGQLNDDVIHNVEVEVHDVINGNDQSEEFIFTSAPLFNSSFGRKFGSDEMWKDEDDKSGISEEEDTEISNLDLLLNSISIEEDVVREKETNNNDYLHLNGYEENKLEEKTVEEKNETIEEDIKRIEEEIEPIEENPVKENKKLVEKEKTPEPLVNGHTPKESFVIREKYTKPYELFKRKTAILNVIIQEEDEGEITKL